MIDLSQIKVLWRQPDTMALWGIPYEMRSGQSPKDIWKSHHDWEPPLFGHYGSKQTDISDWVYLGNPGWWGNIPTEDYTVIQEFLDKTKEAGLLPENPGEWAVL